MTGKIFRSKKFKCQHEGWERCDAKHYSRPSEIRLNECWCFLRNVFGHLENLRSTPDFDFLAELPNFGEDFFPPRPDIKSKEPESELDCAIRTELSTRYAENE